jgi:uncharacterized RDD family membrane protein YckC
VDLEDRIMIATAEGIELPLVLAGAGSRCVASLIDIALQGIAIVLAAIVCIGIVGGGLGAALFAIAAFAALIAYNILFEALASGRTPGKRMTQLRVVREGGTPVDLPASAIRTLVRLIDLLPAAYLLGLGSILLSKRNQRLGDIAAGTIVIRDPRPRAQSGPEPGTHEALDSDGWDVSAVSAEELAAVRRYLQRRESLDRRVRRELAYRFEQGLRTKVSGAPERADPERFLEALARAKAER